MMKTTAAQKEILTVEETITYYMLSHRKVRALLHEGSNSFSVQYYNGRTLILKPQFELTFLSLLIPAFSLQNSPLLLIGTASSCFQCSSTNVKNIPKLRCRVLAPDIFGAGPLD